MGGKAFSSDFFVDRRAQWLEKAKRNTPTLVVSEKHPVNMVAVVEDTASFQKWKAVPAGNTDSFYGMEFTRETVAILDFGEHLTGHVSFSLAAGKSVPDSPVSKL
jgi:hypothetical protein